MAKKFDSVVIGCGVAGGAVASECRSAGLNVAVVESRGYGGTCPLRGCNPKKVLVGAAEILAREWDMKDKGIASQSEIKWSELIRFKRTFTDPVPGRIEKALRDSGVETYHGAASFIGANTIQVGKEVLDGKFFLIGSGAVPRRLGIPGEEHVASSEHFLDLESLPESIVFVGGGYISFEFAHVAARAGAKAIILHRSQKTLKNFDPDLVRSLVKASEAIGIDVHVDMPVHSVEKRRGGLIVYAGKKGERTFESQLVMHGAGRVANLDGLNLEQAGVKTSEKGITVNDYMQSVSNPSVYAAGDNAETPFPLTPAASLEAKVAAENIIHGNHVKIDHRGIPSVAFTIPPLASVGTSEEELQEKGIEYEKKYRDTSKWFSSARIGLKHSGFKVLTGKGSRLLLGAHLLGHHAEEVINVFALAIRLGLTSDDLKKAIWTYPSSVYDIKHMLD